MQDIPEDPTGELDKVEKFVEKNLDICKWAALSVVVMEVSRSSVSTIVMQSYCCSIVAHQLAKVLYMGTVNIPLDMGQKHQEEVLWLDCVPPFFSF
jgi:hypothetical protein